VAYLCSILIHAVALALLAVLVLRAIENGGAPESVVADTRITVTSETPAPETPLPVATPVPVTAGGCLARPTP
jgi:hypothetical protein